MEKVGIARYIKR